MKEIGGNLHCTAGAGGGNIKIPKDSQVKVNKRGVQNCKLDAILTDAHCHDRVDPRIRWSGQVIYILMKK